MGQKSGRGMVGFAWETVRVVLMAKARKFWLLSKPIG